MDRNLPRIFNSTHIRLKSAKLLTADYEALSLTRLSKNFILRDFLFSTQSAALGFNNFPECPDLVIAAGRSLCEKILEPTLTQFGRFAITFGYQCRQAIEADLSSVARHNPKSSNPHQWDRCTFEHEVYARVDILPFCVQDGITNKQEFGHWLMYNLDVDLLMQWTRSNVFCISISPKPRRVWLEWGDVKNGEPKQTTFMGANYWKCIYPSLIEKDRPKFGPSCTGGSMQWRGNK